MSSNQTHFYTFDAQSEIFDILDKHHFPYDKCPIRFPNNFPSNYRTDSNRIVSNKILELAIYKLFLYDFIDNEFIHDNNQNIPYLYYLGAYHHIHNNIEKSIECWEKIHDYHRPPKIYEIYSISVCNILIKYYMSIENWNKTIEYLKSDHNSEDKTWYLIGFCYEQLKDYENMKDYYQDAIGDAYNINPDNYDPDNGNYDVPDIDSMLALANYYNTIEKNKQKYHHYLLLSAQFKHVKSLYLLESEYFGYISNIDPENTEFDSNLLEKIEKEMIRLEFIESQQKSSAS